MYDEIPSLLYVAGALIAVLSWTLFAFSKTIPSRRSKSLHPVPLRYLDIVLCEFDTGTRAISAFRGVLRIHGSRCPRFL